MKKVKLVAVIATVMLAAPVAMAGFTQSAAVSVDLDIGFAQGDLISARNARSDNVFIGCGSRNFDDGAGGVFGFGFCQAEDEEGDRVVCFTQNPALVDTIRTVSDTSYIGFRFVDDGNGGFTCMSTSFSTQSFYLDKHTMGNQRGDER